MAFRLRAEESVAHGLQRLAKKNLRAALDELGRTSPPSDEAIYEARTRLKKARAILHTIQVDDGRLNRDEKRLRKVSRILSSLRDADAMEQIFVKLRDRDPHLFSEHTFARLRRQLTSHRREVMETAARDGLWEKASRHLRKLRRAAKRWRPTHREFGALARALRISHKDGRKAMARALKHQGADDFHAWRKAIKSLWYQLRLIEPCGPRIRRDVAALHRAAVCLGDDHNLAVLCAELSQHALSCDATVDFDRVQLAADRYRCELRNKAIAGMRSLLERKSRAYVREIRRAWQARRQRERTAPHATLAPHSGRLASTL